MPHGLHVDDLGRVWLTDIAMHQVFLFSKAEDGKMVLVRTLGEAFVPGSDAEHFCGPTAVAVASDSSFFVADGCSNSRIIHFSKNGDYLHEWGQPEASCMSI